MNRRAKILLFLLLIGLQIVNNRYVYTLKVNIDFLFLILVYISSRSNFGLSILTAALIGLFTDFFSAGVLGIFGFSRTLAAYLIYQVAVFLDIRKSLFLFFSIALSLSLSNFLANFFLVIILDYRVSPHLVLYTPLLTALAGTLLLMPRKLRELLDVY